MREPTETDVRRHLESLLSSECLSKSVTNQRLLGYLVRRSSDGSDGPKEAEIAIEVFGRDAAFTGGDDSVVRVAMRSLRQKLLEYYAGPGKSDPLRFEIPKGAYRLTVVPRDDTPSAQPANGGSGQDRGATMTGAQEAGRRGHGRALALLSALLCLSLAGNVRQWYGHGPAEPDRSETRSSVLWKELASSSRPLMFVLGDLFMYTQSDPVTGRIQTVRDPQINSSDDLRAFLAGRPELAAARGLRYASYIQKSTAAGVVAVIPIVGASRRTMEVRLRDELRTEDLHRYDIVYLGPISRIGPLDGSFHGHSRYRFDTSTAVLTDVRSGQAHRPAGDLASHHTDYALVSRFRGPAGNSILVITAGGRNAGLQQVIRVTTTPDGIESFDRRLRQAGVSETDAFEALLSVTGYKQTDLAADILDVHRIPASPAATVLPAEAVPASTATTTAQTD